MPVRLADADLLRQAVDPMTGERPAARHPPRQGAAGARGESGPGGEVAGRHAAPAPVVVGLDVGGTSVNVTVADTTGRFLVDRLVERPSRVVEGPSAALDAVADALAAGLAVAGVRRSAVVAVGLDTPGPASADGVISVAGATNFSAAPWRGFDIRRAAQDHLGLPVTYVNDGNAAALYAHHVHFGAAGPARSSVSVVVGTGLGGGLVVADRVVAGAVGMAGELGHVPLPLDGILQPDQPVPRCNCGGAGDAESMASLTAIEHHLLTYWLARHPGHPLEGQPVAEAARAVRRMADQGDPMARRILAQQAATIGRLLTVCAAIVDPDAFFVGGGVLEASEDYRQWFLGEVRRHLRLRPEQRGVEVAVVPGGDMAGARGAALVALAALADRSVGGSPDVC